MSDIRQWLEELGLGQYADAFDENDINFGILPRLTSDDLKDTLGGSVIELKVPEERQSEALQALRVICGTEPSVNQLSREITVPAVEGAKTLTEVVRALDAASIVPTDLALHKPSLDDVFLTLTGHPAETETEEPEPNGARGRFRRRKS